MTDKDDSLKSFWTSLPGILTGVAALITAVGGVLIFFNGGPTVEFFDANPDNIISGDSVTLSWGTSDATYVTIKPGVGSVDLSGSVKVSPTENTTYELKAMKDGKSDNATKVVTVKAATEVVVDPIYSTVTPTIESFKASPENIVSGKGVTLSWNVSDAANVTLNQGIGSVDLSGSIIVYPAENTTYTLRAINLVGSVDSSIIVSVDKSDLDIEFVSIPAGKFTMGSPSSEKNHQVDEGPVHEVTIEAFELGKYEITQKQWVEVMGSNPSKWIGDDFPVGHVSKNNVEEFIEKLNEREGTDKYRLPTEAEWEYACRAGTTAAYSFGDDESKLGDYAWYNANSDNQIHPVGQKKPNSWGLYDMHGNVWEWVQDDSHDSYDGAPSDGSAWGSGETSRGGSYSTVAKFCRSANRNGCDPEDTIGFRLVREI